MKGFLLYLMIAAALAAYAQPADPARKAGILSWYIQASNQSRQVPKLSEYLEVDYRMSVGSNDSLLNETFSTGARVHLPVNHPSFKDVFLKVRPGDRLQIMISTDSFYKYTTRRPVPSFLKPGDSLSFYLKIYEILDDEGLMKKQMAENDEQIANDSALFHRYLLGYRNVLNTERGLYYTITRQGNGRQARQGDSVTITYRGYFLDGKVFDKDEDGYSFITGLGQVIAGLDEAIPLMKEGMKMKLFIPYYLAYGSEGTSTIPPYSSLIFDVELLLVKPNH